MGILAPQQKLATDKRSSTQPVHFPSVSFFFFLLVSGPFVVALFHRFNFLNHDALTTF